LIQPKTVLISAGVDNTYGHPDEEAVNIFNAATTNVYATNTDGGQSILTEITTNGVKSFVYTA